MALKNMTSLRHLELFRVYDATILDGCTFQLDQFHCSFDDSEPLRKFLASQPSLTYVHFHSRVDVSIPFEQTLLPNLTRVRAHPEWLPTLIPGRPVSSIVMYGHNYTHDADDFNLSFLALSTGPLLKLNIPFNSLYPKPASFLTSTFLMYLVLSYTGGFSLVRKTFLY